MSDDLVKRLRKSIAVYFGDRGHVFEDDALCDDAADRIEALGAENMALRDKLAKAVEALSEAIYLLHPTEEDIARGAGLYRIVTTFKELKGQDDE